MKKTLYTVLLVFTVIGAAAVAGCQAPAQAELSDAAPPLPDPMYMKFDGIDGESKDNAHRDWIDVLSFQFGVSCPRSGAGLASRYRSYVTTYDVTITKYVDKSSPKLLEALTSGTMIREAHIDFTRIGAGGAAVIYLRYELQDVQITGYHVSMSSEDYLPLEEVSFNYGRIAVTYTVINEMGQAQGDVEWNYVVTRGDR